VPDVCRKFFVWLKKFGEIDSSTPFTPNPRVLLKRYKGEGLLSFLITDEKRAFVMGEQKESGETDRYHRFSFQSN